MQALNHPSAKVGSVGDLALAWNDGPGIPEADRERVFEPFVRLKNTKNNRFAGHGLGLAIARRAVQCHGGDIKVLESPLGGARFSINWKV